MSTLQLTPAQVAQAQTAQWKEILRQAAADHRGAVPAIVQSVDYTKNPPVVTVGVAVSELVRTPAGPEWTAIWPIGNVPLVVLSLGGFSFTFPASPGDEGLLVFCDSCIDLWWANGASSQTDAKHGWAHGGPQPPSGAPLVQPQFERRRHDLSDCGFVPGMRSQARPISNWSQTSVQLRKDDGTAYIELTAAGAVNIVAPGGLNITGPTVGSGEGTFNSIPVSTHLHTGVTSGGSDTGTPIP